MCPDNDNTAPAGTTDGEPFQTAEEAWMWYAHCQIARLEGARYLAGMARRMRPCDPDDIYRVVARLHRDSTLDDRHITVLGRFGSRLAPPDQGDGAGTVSLWEEALDHLATALRPKGIVA
jgi:hypothetical protein